jgi:hypothetical protein
VASRPANSQRRTLSRQSLVSQSTSHVVSFTSDEANRIHLILDVAVSGSAEGLTVTSFNGADQPTIIQASLVSPTDISFPYDGVGLIVWVTEGSLLRTKSNGQISARPIALI